MADRAGVEHAVCGALAANCGTHCMDNRKGNEHTAGGALSDDAGRLSRLEALVDELYDFDDADGRRRFIDGVLKAAAPPAR